MERRLRNLLFHSNRERLVLESNDLGKLELPLDVVTGLDLPRAATPAFAEAITWLDRARLPQQDRVLLANGDLIEGFVTGIDREFVEIDTGGGETRISMGVVTAVRLVSSGIPMPNDLHFRITLRDGATATAMRPNSPSGRPTVARFQFSPPSEVLYRPLPDPPEVKK